MALPKNKYDPTNCKGGWFYINSGSIDVVTYNGNIGKVTRRQMQAALKLMRKPKKK